MMSGRKYIYVGGWGLAGLGLGLRRPRAEPPQVVRTFRSACSRARFRHSSSERAALHAESPNERRSHVSHAATSQA